VKLVGCGVLGLVLRRVLMRRWSVCLRLRETLSRISVDSALLALTMSWKRWLKIFSKFSVL